MSSSTAALSKPSCYSNRRFWPAEDFSLISDETAHEYFHTTQRQPGPRGILCSYSVGDKADVLAAQSQSERQAQLVRDLSAVSGDAPKALITSVDQPWQDDPMGPWCVRHLPARTVVPHSPLLEQPHGKVLFAGEHLAEWQGFMEGAVDTGEIAAAHLLH